MVRLLIATVAGTLLLTGCGGSEKKATGPEGSGEESTTSKYLVAEGTPCPTSFGDPVATNLNAQKSVIWAGSMSTIPADRETRTSVVDIATGDAVHEFKQESGAGIGRFDAIGVANGYTVSYVGSVGTGLDAKDSWITVRTSGDGTEVWRKENALLTADGYLGTATTEDPNTDAGHETQAPFFDPVTGNEIAEPKDGSAAYDQLLNSKFVLGRSFDDGTKTVGVVSTNSETGATKQSDIADEDAVNSCGELGYILKNETLYVVDAATLAQKAELKVPAGLTDIKAVQPGGALLSGDDGTVTLLPGK